MVSGLVAAEYLEPLSDEAQRAEVRHPGTQHKYGALL
jgi:hypothetical protein